MIRIRYNYVIVVGVKGLKVLLPLHYKFVTQQQGRRIKWQ